MRRRVQNFCSGDTIRASGAIWQGLNRDAGSTIMVWSGQVVSRKIYTRFHLCNMVK